MSSIPKARRGVLIGLSVVAVGAVAVGAVALFGGSDNSKPVVVSAGARDGTEESVVDTTAITTDIVSTTSMPVASVAVTSVPTPVLSESTTLPVASPTSVDVVAPVASQPTSAIPLVIATDLPMQGYGQDASEDTNLAVALVLEQAGYKAGNFDVQIRPYDNSTEQLGGWSDEKCAANAVEHIAKSDEVAVMGAYNSGCTKIQLPALHSDPTGPILMVSHANTNPGLTRAWDLDEPERFYPSGVRNYGRVNATDDYQGEAAAKFAAQELGVKRCIVLTDDQTFGVGMAASFAAAAPALGIEVVAVKSWDPTAASYLRLFKSFELLKPDCFYLGGINDNNGEQLVRDKVQVFGPNDATVKLLAPDGFAGYPTLQEMPEAQGMYITYSGLPISAMVGFGGGCVQFVADFTARFGHEPRSAYALYGAAATQLILKAIAASDGTRVGVRDAAFAGVSVPQAESVICRDVGFDAQGETITRDISMQLMVDNQEILVSTFTL